MCRRSQLSVPSVSLRRLMFGQLCSRTRINAYSVPCEMSRFRPMSTKSCMRSLILLKVTIIKFHEDPFSGSRVFNAYGPTDERTERI
jgi:hypothetical protein